MAKKISKTSPTSLPNKSYNLEFDLNKVYDTTKQTLGGIPMEEGMAKMLSEEAKALEHMLIWDIFMNTWRKSVVDTAFNTDVPFDKLNIQLLTARTMLAATTQLKNLVQSLKKQI